MQIENIYSSNTAINWPLTGKNSRGRGMCGLVIVKCGLRLGRMRNGYVKKIQ
jgi:hypothetical protein